MVGAPIDYWSQLAPVDVGAMLTQGYQEGEQRKLLAAQQQRALEQQAKLDEAREAYIANPTAQGFNALTVLDPKSSESVKRGFDAMDADQQKTTLSELSAIRGYLRAGNPTRAAALLKRRIEADKAAGQDVADDESMLAEIEEDPGSAAGLVDYMLAATMGPDKWESTYKTIGEDQRATAKLPAEVGKLESETAKLGAETEKLGAEAVEVAPNAESERGLRQAQVENFQSAITERAERLNLDRDKLETSTQLEIEKLTNKGVDLSPGAEKAMSDAVVSAESSRQLATRASTLAERMKTGGLGAGGWGSWLIENAKGIYGSPTELRKEYTALINQQAVKNLPPGPASDRDIQLALKGFPSPTSNAETMVSFLNGMAKLQTLAANREQARADWISENGNIGRARKDITVNGVKVPAGSTYGDFSASAASIERREAVGERSYFRFGK